MVDAPAAGLAATVPEAAGAGEIETPGTGVAEAAGPGETDTPGIGVAEAAGTGVAPVSNSRLRLLGLFALRA